MAFANLEQAMAEDRADVTNQTAASSTITEQVLMYANRLSTKETDNVALQTVTKNLQEEVKNLEAKVTN